MNLFINGLFTEPRLFFSQLLIVTVSICCHEFCHAWTALKFGDTTAADAGHLTLNPIRQMGLISLLMLALIGIAWGSVPVDPARMRHRYAPAAVAAAGPGCNLVLSQIFVLAAFGYTLVPGAQYFPFAMLFFGAVINLVLCIFNALPLPGLDGWSVLTNFFPQLARGNSEVLKGSMFMLIVLLIAFFDKLADLAIWAANGELELLAGIVGR